MLLRTRFIVLIVLVSASVASVLASVTWSAWLLKRDVSDVFDATTQVLNKCRSVALASETVRASLDGRRVDAKGVLPARAAGLHLHIDQLVSNPDVSMRIGVISAGTLRASASEVEDEGLRWLETGEEDARDAAAEALLDLSDLVRRLESRALEDSALAIQNGQRIGQRLVLITGLVFLTVLLTGLLAVVLFRRWVTRPVGRLRRATEQIGTGDFSVRVPVAGQDELSDLGEAVNRMAGTIEAMQEERVQRERLAAAGELIRRLSHNLRNPLAGIRGVAEVSRRRAVTADDNRQRDDMDRIIRSVDRLDEWLSDLLSSTSPVEIHPASQDVRLWLERLIDAHRPIAQMKSVELQVLTDDAPDKALFDRRHLDQAVTALVTNAIQATPSSGRVVVEASAVEGGIWWELEVSDTGPGVPEDVRPSVFKPHFTTKPDGTGLGLSVAQQVVQRHGGMIELRPVGRSIDGSDAPLVGAAFVIRLPLRGPSSDNVGHMNGEHRAEGSGD
jgi:signal transduction histidine kinase